jgi:branched-subunit amino acid transport protein|tara:strand:- start:142 stop:474 length:333 start_codon:yes stop_codon:yes gene_type:complete
MSEMSSNIILVILVTSFATYLSRFLGVVSSEKIDAKSKIFRWFNCIAYSILAALIARIVIFPAGVLEEADLWIRLIVIIISIIIFIISKRNLVYPTVLSAILLALLNNYL